MNLFEWKKENTESIREDLKSNIRDGLDVATHYLFSEDEINQMREEVEIEEFNEAFEFDESNEVDLENVLIEDWPEPQEILEFIPEETGEKMDIEVEIDLNLYDPSVQTIGAIRDAMFAEDYEIEMLDEARAKVVFNRAGGQIKKRKVCGPKMRLVGNRCMPQTGTQKAGERRKGIKLKRAKKAMGAGAKKRASIKAKITKKRVGGRARNLSGTVN